MTELKLRYKSLTVNSLDRKLEKLSQDLEIEILDLTGNKLKDIPDLRRYRQFHKLKTLNVSGNRLATLNAAYIPQSTEVIVLDRTYIIDVPDLSSLLNLKVISLQRNRIEQLSPKCIPSSVTDLNLSGQWDLANPQILPDISHLINLNKLDLSHNKVKLLNGSHLPVAIAELKLQYNSMKVFANINHLINLKTLDLSNNKITHINGSHLPVSITDLNLSDNSLVELPDISHVTNLSTVDITFNKITQLTGAYLPASVTNLALRRNLLVEVTWIYYRVGPVRQLSG